MGQSERPDPRRHVYERIANRVNREVTTTTEQVEEVVAKYGTTGDGFRDGLIIDEAIAYGIYKAGDR